MSEKIELGKLGKKRCTNCQKIKELGQFRKSTQGFLGKTPQCISCLQEYDKKFINNRKERDKTKKAKEYRKNYIKNNIDWWREYEKNYRKLRRQEDMFFRIKGNLSARISSLIKGKKDLSTLKLLGCDENYFIQYLECKFQEGMNWSNYGIKGWQIDHIIPLSKFDLLIEEEVKKACHHSNLQPLWWEDNLLKSNKIKPVFIGK